MRQQCATLRSAQRVNRFRSSGDQLDIVDVRQRPRGEQRSAGRSSRIAFEEP
jgi:hypothetical protein